MNKFVVIGDATVRINTISAIVKQDLLETEGVKVITKYCIYVYTNNFCIPTVFQDEETRDKTYTFVQETLVKEYAED